VFTPRIKTASSSSSSSSSSGSPSIEVSLNHEGSGGRRYGAVGSRVGLIIQRSSVRSRLAAVKSAGCILHSQAFPDASLRGCFLAITVFCSIRISSSSSWSSRQLGWTKDGWLNTFEPLVWFFIIRTPGPVPCVLYKALLLGDIAGPTLFSVFGTPPWKGVASEVPPPLGSGGLT